MQPERSIHLWRKVPNPSYVGPMAQSKRLPEHGPEQLPPSPAHQSNPFKSKRITSLEGSPMNSSILSTIGPLTAPTAVVPSRPRPAPGSSVKAVAAKGSDKLCSASAAHGSAFGARLGVRRLVGAVPRHPSTRRQVAKGAGSNGCGFLGRVWVEGNEGIGHLGFFRTRNRASNEKAV